MVKARDKGLIGGIGLSNITREHLLRALAITDIACVQNPMNLADRHSLPVLNECEARGIAFVPFFPLGSAFARGNPGPAQPPGHEHRNSPRPHSGTDSPGVLLSFRPNILLIPGTSSVPHLEENMAVRDIELDAAAREALASAS
jgi:pyridoxine 4-dehydrogenase